MPSTPQLASKHYSEAKSVLRRKCDYPAFPIIKYSASSLIIILSSHRAFSSPQSMINILSNDHKSYIPLPPSKR